MAHPTDREPIREPDGAARRRRLRSPVSLNLIHRVLPKRWFFVLHAYRYKLFAEPETRFVEQMCDKDSTVVDVGACWGSYTYFFAKAAREVLALEPNPDLAAYLQRVVPDNVTVRHAAASDTAGRATLRIPRHGRDPFALASLSDDAEDDAFRVVEVETVRLDDLGLDDVGLLKIDVEGHEEAVLDGAVGLLTGRRPEVLIEMEERHRPGVVARIGERFASYGYEGAFYLDGSWVPFEEFSVDLHQDTSATSVNSREYINLFFFSATGRHRRLGEAKRSRRATTS